MNVACNGFEIDEKERVTLCDEGEVALFDIPTDGKITELYVDVLPKQRGSGDPTPSNIRPIEGYDRAVIHHLTGVRDVDYVSRLEDVVYAGTIDLVKGIVTAEYAILNIDGSKTVGAVTGHPNSFTYSLGASCLSPNTRGTLSNGWCTHYKVLTDVNSSQFYAEDKVVGYANTSLSAVAGRAIFTDTDYSSSADFKTFLQTQALNGTPVQMVFRLEEPITFECEPLSIRTISGINYLVSEDGIIHACLEYFADTEEPTESVTMPFGCQVGCTVSEYHTVEPLPVEERDPKDVCPPGMPNKWEIDDIPHEDKYCDGEGMDCVCNPMAIATGIPCYKTIYIPELPETGMEGIMYVVPVDDKYAVYMWDGAEFYPVTATAVLVPLTITPSTSAQDIDPTGADGFSHVHVDAEAMGALAPPTIEYGTNLGSGVIWAHSSVGVGGYIQQGESLDGFEYCSHILPTENAKTVTPTTSEQVAVAANKWTNGQIKVGAIPAEYIIPSGTKNINSNGNAQDVKNYEYVNVNVPGITPTGEKQINVSTNGTVTEDVTNYATAKVVTNVPASAVDSGTKNITANGNNQDVVGYAAVNVNVPASAVDTGTKNITSNGNNQNVVGYAAVNVNVPNSYSASDEGKVVDNGALVSQTALTVNANGTYDTTKNNSVVVNVPGGKAVQISNSNGRVNTTAYSDTGVTLTVAKSGTYDVYWSGFRSSTSGTNGTQLYKNGSAYGSAQTTFTNSYNQTVRLTNVSLAEDDVLKIYARARGTNYYMCAANLTIIEV